MKKMIIKSICSAVIFCMCYCLISLIMGDDIVFLKTLSMGVIYLVIMFLLYMIQPKLRELLGYKDSEE